MTQRIVDDIPKDDKIEATEKTLFLVLKSWVSFGSTINTETDNYDSRQDVALKQLGPCICDSKMSRPMIWKTLLKTGLVEQTDLQAYKTHLKASINGAFFRAKKRYEPRPAFSINLIGPVVF